MGSSLCWVFFRDCTQRKLKEETIISTSKELALQNKILHFLTSDKASQYFYLILNTLVTEFLSKIGLLGILQKNGDLLTIMTSTQINAQTHKAKFITYKKDSIPKVFSDILNGGILNGSSTPKFHIPILHNILSHIKSYDSIIGFILIANKETETDYTSNERTTLDRITNWLVPFIRSYTEKVAEKAERKKINKEKEIYQKELIQASKLATIGTLASGIAHELNNPLSAVKGFAQLISRDSSISADTKNNVLQIIQAATRMQKIIEHLRTFSRKSNRDDLKVIDIINIVEQTNAFFEQKLKLNGIKLELTKNIDKAIVKGDPIQLESVFQNLITNSIDAFETIKDDREKKISICVGANPIGDMTIEYKDNAGGMPEEVLSRIFEPFFTTKEVGKGTGLGMSLTHRIIQEHKGTISVSSNENVGSTFLITIPMYFDKETVIGNNNASNNTNIKMVKSKILVIDDEILVTNLLTEYLKDTFYVEKANLPNAGLDMIKNNEYDLVLIDIKMPELNGIELLKRIKAIKLQLPVVLMTGSVGIDEREAEIYRLGASGILRKPFEDPNAVKEYLSEIISTKKMAA